MKRRKIQIIAGVAALVAVGGLTLAACSSGGTPDSRKEQLNTSQKKFDSRKAPDVTGDAEYNNYIRAQEDVYDDPSTIIWCTASFPNDTSPIFTVPIAGKLTSSSVSFYPNSSPHTIGSNDAAVVTENQSVDGMYHGSPPPYRYGFTPGGQYVDFSGLAVFCTTSLTEFQRQTLQVAQVVTGADSVQKQAEAALKAKDGAKAQDLVDSLAGKK